jgi:hypothetical protein
MLEQAIKLVATFGALLMISGSIFVYETWNMAQVSARDLDGRYAQSPLKPWFDKLASKKGLCCSFADGLTVLDPDWESKDGHYRVRLDEQWWDIPDEAVITEPNQAGRTMVWPMRINDGETLLRIDIRCFLPGAMT